MQDRTAMEARCTPSPKIARNRCRAAKRDRPMSRVLLGVGMAQVVLTYLNLPAWRCPFRMMTGLPCPGCGLTRATIALLHLNLHEALALHPFSPLALAAAIGAIVKELPIKGSSRAIASQVAAKLFRAGLAEALGIALLIWWLIHLLVLTQR